MSAVLTTYGRQLMVNAFFTPDIFVPVPQLYYAYTLEVPESNADGSTLVEPATAAGYARVSYALNAAHWSPTGFGEVYNALVASFPALTAEWGLLQGLALVDASALGTGNVVLVGSLSEPWSPEIGDVPTVDPGDVTVGLFE